MQSRIFLVLACSKEPRPSSFNRPIDALCCVCGQEDIHQDGIRQFLDYADLEHTLHEAHISWVANLEEAINNTSAGMASLKPCIELTEDQAKALGFLE